MSFLVGKAEVYLMSSPETSLRTFWYNEYITPKSLGEGKLKRRVMQDSSTCDLLCVGNQYISSRANCLPTCLAESRTCPSKTEHLNGHEKTHSFTVDLHISYPLRLKTVLDTKINTLWDAKTIKPSYNSVMNHQHPAEHQTHQEAIHTALFQSLHHQATWSAQPRKDWPTHQLHSQ